MRREPRQRGQAAVGEAGAAGLEHRLPDQRLAVDALGDADERHPAAAQVRRPDAASPRRRRPGRSVSRGSGIASPLRRVVDAVRRRGAATSGGRGRRRRGRSSTGSLDGACGSEAACGHGSPSRRVVPTGDRGPRCARRGGGVLEVVDLAAREGGAAMVVRACVYHSVHVSPGAGGAERAQYTSLTGGEFRRAGGTMPATDPLFTVRDGHLCFDGVDLVDLADRHETPFFVFSERRLRANVERLTDAFRRAVTRRPRSSSPARRAPTCGSCTWCAMRAPASRSTPAESSRRRCGSGFEPRADRLQRGRQDEGRDRARSRLRRARLHGRLAVRAPADRRGRHDARPRRAGRSAHRRARADD